MNNNSNRYNATNNKSEYIIPNIKVRTLDSQESILTETSNIFANQGTFDNSYEEDSQTNTDGTSSVWDE